ncbi:MAG: peptide chain release factor 1 [Kiritimatiellae bacterium]|nr:peptide chain release factor 1 [Kiritimatiellia bacterium]
MDSRQIENVLGRLASVESDLSDPAVLSDAKRYRATLRDHAFLKKLEAAYSAYRKIVGDIRGNEELLSDPDFKDEAAAEIASLKAGLEGAERHVLAALLPPDPLEARHAVMEIRAGTGGEEAALFAGDLFRMYSRYCETQGWKVSVMNENATSLDGYKEIVFTVVGEGAYGRFRFESGGHRVQRVPETEAQGRIHTSAATVIVFPEADEEDELEIPEKDIRIDLFCAGGAGGQHVNKTESAVRMTHLPTGLVATCQDERSQQRNREKCLATLKARILDFRRRQEEAKLGADRLSLRGSGDRSERIRTYNFPQNRMTDHRIDLTLYSLDRIINGEMGPLLDALASHDLSDRIAHALDRRET